MESATENQVPMEDKLAARFAELEEKIKNMPQEEQDRVRDAYTYAKEHHDGQLRKDGSPYITHPLEVAHLVADLGLDADSIIAALLHDTIEDTDATHEEVAKRFGVTVANLVEGVTKLNKVKYTSTEEKQMENLRKMLMAMAQDVRVILIKICDRVHNIRTLEYQSEKKQREKALETLEIYAPIAHRLGMQRMKWEMEDESLRFLDPVAYKEISDELAAQAKAHAAFMERIQNEIQDRLKKEGIKGTVYGRVKHVYSIYRKMYAQNKKLSEIFDLYAFRVIVDDIPTCYSVLGCIHDMYKAVLGRFKDYIGTPKPNMYQSLHTTVIGSEGIPFEVQIRTWEMHHMAEYGVAGMTECMVKFAKCCTPVPGDPIVGFITRGYGVSVHRADCPNAISGQTRPGEKDRWIKVSWDPDSLNTYKTSLDIIAKDRPGLAMDVTTVMATAKMNILAMTVNVLPDGYTKFNLVVEVRGQGEVTTIMNKLNQVKNVYQVSRVSG